LGCGFGANPAPDSEAVLLGDFNSEPHDAVYERWVGPKDEYSGRVHRIDSFVDTWAIGHDVEIDV